MKETYKEMVARHECERVEMRENCPHDNMNMHGSSTFTVSSDGNGVEFQLICDDCGKWFRVSMEKLAFARLLFDNGTME